VLGPHGLEDGRDQVRTRQRAGRQDHQRGARDTRDLGRDRGAEVGVLAHHDIGSPGTQVVADGRHVTPSALAREVLGELDLGVERHDRSQRGEVEDGRGRGSRLAGGQSLEALRLDPRHLVARPGDGHRVAGGRDRPGEGKQRLQVACPADEREEDPQAGGQRE
jgi:hypothetical protein